MADQGDRQKQEARREASRRIYSTKLIDQMVKDRSEGYDIDWEPFFNRELDLRAPNIPFRMTEEELEEYQRCYDDPEYYIEKYCKFQTDDGWATIQLRDFQRKIIDVVTDEVYDPENDKVYPTNRNVIWMASRQTGKCVKSLKINNLAKDESSNEHLSDCNPDVVSIEDKYYDSIKRKTFVDRLIHMLSRLYCKL